MDDDAGTGRWMTYDELAEVRGIKRIGAVRLVQRYKWRRQAGNDGRARVLVPHDALEKVRGTDAGTNAGSDAGHDDAGTSAGTAAGLAGALSALEDAVSALREQLDAANARAERAEADRADERLRADRAETAVAAERQRADDLRAQIDVLNAEMVVMRAEADRARAEERLRADRLSEQVEAGHRDLDAARADADTLRSQVEGSERDRNHATEVADKAVKAAEALQGDLTLVQTALEQAKAELAVAQHDAQAGQQAAAVLRQAEAERRARGLVARLRAAWWGR